MGLDRLSNKEKADAFNALLARFNLVVTLDAMHEGAEVPEHLRKPGGLGLLYGLNLAIPIPDLTVTEEGIAGTLSFDREPFETFVPWEAVAAVVIKEPGPQASRPAAAKPAPRPRHLSAVKADAPFDSEDAGESAEEPGAQGGARPALRLVRP